MIRGLLRVILFIALGPFIGSLGAAAAIGISTFTVTGSLRDFTGWQALVSPPLLIVSYTVGVVPALLTAIVCIVIERQMQGWRLWLWAALSGAIIACVLAWLVFGAGPVGSGLRPVVFTVVIGSAGALAGLVCAALFDGLASLPGRR